MVRQLEHTLLMIYLPSEVMMDGGERACILRDMLLAKLGDERLCISVDVVISVITVITIGN